MSADNPIHVDHPDDERFDAIDIHVEERWKESELSGDEWRFSYVAKVKRKGETIITVGASRLEWLLQGLQWQILISSEDNKFDHEAWARTKELCDQPGCAEVPVIFYKRLRRYTRQGEELVSNSYRDGNEYRQFCDRHRHRGDCGLDDSEANYQEIVKP